VCVTISCSVRILDRFHRVWKLAKVRSVIWRSLWTKLASITSTSLWRNRSIDLATAASVSTSTMCVFPAGAGRPSRRKNSENRETTNRRLTVRRRMPRKNRSLCQSGLFCRLCKFLLKFFLLFYKYIFSLWSGEKYCNKLFFIHNSAI
jgi:hypothetical protein